MGSNLEDDDDYEAQDEGREARATLSTPRLVEGVRDFLLLNLKQAHLQKPWPQMPEREQKQWINRITERAEQLVQDVIDRVATGSFPVVHAKIDNFAIKGGEVKIVAKGFADDQVLLTLNHAGPKAVKIIVADGEQFDEARDPLNPDPDQPGLPGVKLGGEPGFEDDDEKPQVEEPPVENPEGEATAGEEILKPKSDQWRGGFNSRMAGYPFGSNPFPGNSDTGADWSQGWIDADGNPDAKPLGGKPDVDVIAEQAEPETKPADPAPAPKPKKTTRKKAGPIVEPDIEPEVEHNPDATPEGEQPTVENADGAIVDHENVVIESVDQAHAYGVWCRRDGRGTGANPFPVASDFGKAWLRGYSDERRAEQSRPKDDSQEF